MFCPLHLNQLVRQLAIYQHGGMDTKEINEWRQNAALVTPAAVCRFRETTACETVYSGKSAI